MTLNYSILPQGDRGSLGQPGKPGPPGYAVSILL